MADDSENVFRKTAPSKQRQINPSKIPWICYCSPLVFRASRLAMAGIDQAVEIHVAMHNYCAGMKRRGRFGEVGP
jgi:hypothetical protein